MSDINRTILFMVVDAGLVAIVMEAIKKAFGELVVKDGKKMWKNSLCKTVIIIWALLLSIITVEFTYLGGVLIGKPIIVVLYSAIVFAGQWFIDMQVVKKLVDKLIERMLNRV